MVLVVAVLVAMIAGFGCSSDPQDRNEAVLREQLVALNRAASQFTADHGRAPESVSDLYLGEYLRELPVDPFTGRSDTWKLAKNDNSGKPSVEIHSGSGAISSAGTPYYEW